MSITEELAQKAKSIVSKWDEGTQKEFKAKYSSLGDDSAREAVLTKVLDKYGSSSDSKIVKSEVKTESKSSGSDYQSSSGIVGAGADMLRDSNSPGMEFVKGAASGLIKGGANMLDLEQKTTDIVANYINKGIYAIKGTSDEKQLAEKIKGNVPVVHSQVYGNMATDARKFAEDFLKTKTLVGKTMDVIGQAPAFIAETEMLGGRAVGGMAGLAASGAIRGADKEGNIGAQSAMQAGTNAGLGLIFGAISKISPKIGATDALKIVATASRAALGGTVAASTNALLNGELYSTDPDRFDRFIADFAANAVFAALPHGKAENIAESVQKIKEGKTKVINEFIKNSSAKELNDSNDLNLTEYYGTERPASKMLEDVIRKKGDPTSYRDFIKKTESYIEDTQAEKAKIVDTSRDTRIKADPTTGLKTLVDSASIGDEGIPANPRAGRAYNEILNNEKTLQLNGSGERMNVYESWTRQSELRSALNDQARLARGEQPLTRLQKRAYETLISGYGHAMNEVNPHIRELSMREGALIQLKGLLAKRSSSQQMTPKEQLNVQDVSIRGQASLGFASTVLNHIKGIFRSSDPTKTVVKKLKGLQDSLDRYSKYEAKKVVASDKIEVETAKVEKLLQLSDMRGAKQLTSPARTYQPLDIMETKGIEGRITGKQKQLPAPEKFIRTRLASWEQ